MTEPTTPIRVAHITPTLSRRGGGVAEYLWSLVREGRSAGLESVVVGLADQQTQNDLADVVVPGVEVFSGTPVGPAGVGLSFELTRYLRYALGPVDLVHSHGLRMLPAYEARRLASRRGIPRVVSPHGQLDPWIQAHGAFRKSVLNVLYEHRNLRTADCIHATSFEEARRIRAYGLDRPIAVVPIGIDAQAYDRPRDEAFITERFPELANCRRLIFLSTIYKKKNLPMLAEAWVRLQAKFPDWRLVITGPDFANDSQTARDILTRGGAGGRFTITGPVWSADKQRLLSSCDLFCLPTQGENFGIAIGEAMAAGLPVITTQNAPWPELRDSNAGWWIPVGLDPLCAALEAALATPAGDLHAMGLRGRDVIRRRYAWPQIVLRMRSVYLWLLGKGPKPDCVYTKQDAIPDPSSDVAHPR
ncbi:MAG: glycosyltransferase [Planctomycetota bacterium]|nr:glycosyltransferase [Planctomycetota bacterium]